MEDSIFFVMIVRRLRVDIYAYDTSVQNYFFLFSSCLGQVLPIIYEKKWNSFVRHRYKSLRWNEVTSKCENATCIANSNGTMSI
jgi:hypothetical protein